MSVMKELLDISNRVISLLNGKVREIDLKNFEDMCRYGQFELAYENLCTQIYEFDIKISREAFYLLKEMCFYFRLDFSYWRDLETLVVGGVDKNSDIYGKVVFPKSWSEEKIMHEISDIATDPNLEWISLTSNGESVTKDGKPSRFAVKGIRDGVTIRVILEPDGEGIITGYPLLGEGVVCLIMNL